MNKVASNRRQIVLLLVLFATRKCYNAVSDALTHATNLDLTLRAKLHCIAFTRNVTLAAAPGESWPLDDLDLCALPATDPRDDRHGASVAGRDYRRLFTE